MFARDIASAEDRPSKCRRG